MQTIKVPIPVPDGYEIDTFDKAARSVTLKQTPKDVTERIKTVADALRDLGEDDDEVMSYRTLLTLFDANSHIVNYQLAVVIIRSLNEKREPNWNDGTNKYTLYFFLGSSGFRFDDCVNWNSDSDVGSRLCFMEKRLGLHAVEQPEFLKVFERFMTIKK